MHWNIYDGLAKGFFPSLGEKLLRARNEGIIHIPYTEVHLLDAGIISHDVKNQNDLIERNFGVIKEYTEMVCIWEHNNPTGWMIMCSPQSSEFQTEVARDLK